MDDTEVSEEKAQKRMIKFIQSYAKNEKVSYKLVFNYDEENKAFVATLKLGEEAFSATGETKKDAKNKVARLTVKKLKQESNNFHSKVDQETAKDRAKLHYPSPRKKKISRKKRKACEDSHCKAVEPTGSLQDEENATRKEQPPISSKVKKEAHEEKRSECQSGKNKDLEEADDTLEYANSDKLEVTSKNSDKLEVISQNDLNTPERLHAANKENTTSDISLPSIEGALKKKKRTSKTNEKSQKAHKTSKKIPKKKRSRSYEHIVLPPVFSTSHNKSNQEKEENKPDISATSENKATSLPDIPIATEKTATPIKSSPSREKIKKSEEPQTPENKKNSAITKNKDSKKGKHVMLVGNNEIPGYKVISDILITGRRKRRKIKSKNKDGCKEGKQQSSKKTTRRTLNQDKHVYSDQHESVKNEMNSSENSKGRVAEKSTSNSHTVQEPMQQQQQNDSIHTSLPNVSQVADDTGRSAEKATSDGVLRVSLASRDKAKHASKPLRNSKAQNSLPSEDKMLLSSDNFVKTEKARKHEKENKNIIKHKRKANKNRKKNVQ